MLLRHKVSGKYLEGHTIRYTHGRSSNQFAVTAGDSKTEYATWFVKPAHGGPRDPSTMTTFAHGAVVRIENVALRKNLHSHDAPNSTQTASEVTTYGVNGAGDENDDWKLSVLTDTQGGVHVTLQHVKTDAYLTSQEGVPTNIGSEKVGQEVGADRSGPSDAAIWVLEDAEPGGFRPLEPLFTFSVDALIPPKDFFLHQEFTTWAEAEANAIFRLCDQAMAAESSSVKAQVVEHVRRFTEHVRTIAGLVDQGDAAEQIKDSLVAMANRYRSGQMVYSEDPRWETFRKLAANEPVTAGFYLGILFRLSAGFDAGYASMRAAHLAFAADAATGVVTSKESHYVAEVKQMLLAALTAVADRQREAGALNDHAAKNLKETARQADELLASKNKNFQTLEDTYGKHMSLAASVTYWQKKADRHTKFSWIFGVASLGAGVAAFAYVKSQIDKVLGSTGAEPAQYWRYFAILLLATFLIWGLRILVQLFLTNLHQASDAAERVTMIQTFLALLKEESVDKVRDSQLILNTLFRPGSTGLVKEDSGPATPMEVVLKTITERAGADKKS